VEKVIELISGLVDKYAATAAQKYGIVAGVVVAIIIIVAVYFLYSMGYT
jgi:uncharacterized membrane-anchored protein